MNTGPFPPMDQLVIHRPPALLLEEVVEAGEEHCLARLHVAHDAAYADQEGRMPAWYGLEVMAQTISAYSGVRKIAQGQPLKRGLLLGTHRYTAERARFNAGDPVLVRVQLEYLDASGISAFRCEVIHQNVTVARATLKVYEEP